MLYTQLILFDLKGNQSDLITEVYNNYILYTCNTRAIIFLLVDLRTRSHQILGKVE